MQRISLRVLTLLVCYLTVTVNAVGLEIGEKIGPIHFQNLDGVDRVLEADNLASRKGTVLVFLSARSDAVDNQIEYMNDLYARIRLDGILFIGICSDARQSGDELRTYMQNAGSIIPVYRDLDGSVAESFKPSVTPAFFLLDQDGRLAYRGALGDEESGLAIAIEQLLAGDGVTIRSKPQGDSIDLDAPARPSPNRHGLPYFASQMIFQQIPGAAVHHCSTVAEAPNGDILCLWYGGSYESSEDQALYMARLPKGEDGWDTPERLIFDPDVPPGNAVLFRGPDDRLWIIWGRMESPRPIRRGSGWGECRLLYRTSDDNGVTWSEDSEIPGGFGSLPRNLPLTLADGRFGIPLSGEGPEGYGGSYLLFLDPSGPTWTRGGNVRPGGQPTVIQRDNGDLLMLMRNYRRTRQSVSSDGGATWSESVATDLKNPGSAICMTKLASGRILLVFNDTDVSDRTPFNLIQSNDDGKTWEDIRILEADWGEFSYPSIIQSSDGLIHLTYTYRRYAIKHTVFNEDWLTHLLRPN